jgi:hypothetical protein
MPHDALAAESRRNDSLDDVRSAALDRVGRLVDLLGRQRAEFRRSMGHEHRRFEAAGAATRAEMDGRLAACADEEGRAAVLCLMPADRFDDTSLWQYDAEIGPLISRAPTRCGLLVRRSVPGGSRRLSVIGRTPPRLPCVGTVPDMRVRGTTQ